MTLTDDLATGMQDALDRMNPVPEHFGNVASTLADAANAADTAGRSDISNQIDQALAKMVEIVRD